MVAEHDRCPGHALPPDQSYLHLLTARLNGNNGYESTLGKVSGLDSLVGFFKRLPDIQDDGFEMWLQQIEVVR